MALTYQRVILSGATVLSGGATQNGGSSQQDNFVQTFNTTSSWAGPVMGDYRITILEATHEKGVCPSVQIYEQNGLDFHAIVTGISLNSSGDVTISVKEIPDLRFTGKIIIS